MLNLIQAECRNIIVEAQGLLVEYRRKRREAREQKRIQRQRRHTPASATATTVSTVHHPGAGGSSPRRPRYSETEPQEPQRSSRRGTRDELRTPTFNSFTPTVDRGLSSGVLLSSGSSQQRSGRGVIHDAQVSGQPVFPEQVSPEQSVTRSSELNSSFSRHGTISGRGPVGDQSMSRSTSFTRRSSDRAQNQDLNSSFSRSDQ